MDIGFVLFVFSYLLLFFVVDPSTSYSKSTYTFFITLAFVLFIFISGAIDFIGTLYPQYKIQKDTQISTQQYTFTVLRSVAIFIIVIIPTVYGFWKLLAWRQKLGWLFSTIHFNGFVAAFIIAAVITEILSWAIHKLIHIGPLFTYIHSYHHKHIAPICFSCIDAHPIEVIMWDLFPIFAGPMLLGTNANFTILFSGYCILNTIIAHSGFKYPFLSWFDASNHDFHHEKMKCNYAGNFFMDAALDTLEIRKDDIYYPQWNRMAKTYDGTYNERKIQ